MPSLSPIFSLSLWQSSLPGGELEREGGRVHDDDRMRHLNADAADVGVDREPQFES